MYNNKRLPWVEKYRPKKLKDIVEHRNITKMLKKSLKSRELPHLLFSGPSGCGKTSCIIAFARELYGKDYDERVIELNASDERGITVARDKIKTFSKLSANGSDKDNVPFKIIILDEADAMTPDAQTALRKIIEDYSKITRFCFICNYDEKIIEPITSRCVKYRFKHLNKNSVITRLEKIAINEKIDHIDDECLETIYKCSNGDLRRAIMFLQNLKYYDKNITKDDIISIAGYPDKKTLKNIKKICERKDLNEKKIIKFAEYIKFNSFYVYSIIENINKIIIESDMDDEKKSLVCFKISKIYYELTNGADEYFQILTILLYINKILKI